MHPEDLTLELIGGRIQMLADERHGRRRRKRLSYLVIEAARLHVRALEYGSEVSTPGLLARELIALIAADLVQNGEHDAVSEEAIMYMTAACDPDPHLLEELVLGRKQKWAMFTFFCRNIQSALLILTKRAGEDAVLAFCKVSA